MHCPICKTEVHLQQTQRLDRKSITSLYKGGKVHWKENKMSKSSMSQSIIKIIIGEKLKITTHRTQ